jgi:hypothetical protein
MLKHYFLLSGCLCTPNEFVRVCPSRLPIFKIQISLLAMTSSCHQNNIQKLCAHTTNFTLLLSNIITCKSIIAIEEPDHIFSQNQYHETFYYRKFCKEYH